jgi:hypothetical protein
MPGLIAIINDVYYGYAWSSGRISGLLTGNVDFFRCFSELIREIRHGF